MGNQIYFQIARYVDLDMLNMVLFQNCVRQSCSPTKMAAAMQLRCY
jgi:hypothetical protein